MDKAMIPLEARLALEWLNASGPRTKERLRDLVFHFCTANGLPDPDTRDAIYKIALAQDRAAFLDGGR